MIIFIEWKFSREDFYIKYVFVYNGINYNKVENFIDSYVICIKDEDMLNLVNY